MLFTNLITHLIRAGYAERAVKKELVQEACITLDELKYFLQLAWEMKILTNQKYLTLSSALTEVGKMIGAWIKQQRKETPAERENKELCGQRGTDSTCSSRCQSS
mgnify:FL=1